MSSLEQVKHLIPRSERPTGFEDSERLIVDTILHGRQRIKPAIEIPKRIVDMHPPLFEEQQACTG